MKTDSQLRQDVLDELQWDPSVNEPGIGVAVRDRIVTLTGTVNSFAEKRSAEKAARRVAGVHAVVQDIEVKIMTDDQRNDQEIAQVALSCLRWDSMVPKDRVFVKVENGWITLDGEVDWHFQRQAAKKAVQNIRGVRGVISAITLKAATQPHDVKKKIREVFERNAIIDASRIRVHVEGHKVTLEGEVRSWDEKRQAYHVAYSIPGITQVENNLEIKMRTEAELYEK